MVVESLHSYASNLECVLFDTFSDKKIGQWFKNTLLNQDVKISQQNIVVQDLSKQSYRILYS